VRLLCLVSLLIAVTQCRRAEPERSRVEPARSPSPELAAPAASQPAARPGAIDPEAKSFEYPFPVRFFELSTQRQQLRMAYMDVAPAVAARRVALLLHGKNFSGAYWEATIRSLTEAGYRVIAPDQIGFGKSSKPDRYQYSFAGLADNTRRLLDSLGVRASAVVGHSMGGMLATRYALTFRDRVAKLVLVNPIGLEDYAAFVPFRSVDEIYRTELELTPDKIRRYQQANYFAGEWKPEYEPLIQLASGWTLHPDYARVAWSSALTYDMVFSQPVVHDLPRLEVPTLLVIGLRDRTALGRDAAPPELAAKLGNYAELGRRARRAIPKAELVEIPNVGHLPQVEAFPQYSKALLEFLGADPVPAAESAPDAGAP